MQAPLFMAYAGDCHEDGTGMNEFSVTESFRYLSGVTPDADRPTV